MSFSLAESSYYIQAVNQWTNAEELFITYRMQKLQ